MIQKLYILVFFKYVFQKIKKTNTNTKTVFLSLVFFSYFNFLLLTSKQSNHNCSTFMYINKGE